MITICAGPSRRSILALDALHLILADVRGGLGPFLAVYLASVHRWDPGRIGAAMAVMGVAGLVAQTPAGALIDSVRDKRLVIALAFALVAAGALAMVAQPTPPVVLSAQAMIGAAGAVFGPALAAVSLGLVGHAGLARRMGRNQALDHTGNVAAAILAGVIGDAVGYGGIFVLTAALCLIGVLAAALIRGSEVDHARARGGEGVPPEEVSGEAMFDKDLDPPAVAMAVKAPRIARRGELLADRRIGAFAAAVVLFHFANAAMLPLVSQKLAAGLTRGAAGPMAAAIVAAQMVMIPVALLASRLAQSWGRKPTFLIGFAVLPVRGVLYTFGADPRYLVAVQLLDGIGAGIFGVVGVLVIADLTRGTGRFSLMQGALATATGLGAALSNLVTGAVAGVAGFDAGFLTLATIAAAALLFFGLMVPETRRFPARPDEDLPASAVSAIAGTPFLALDEEMSTP
jgi:predicted MFS family arabinose efflux permease